MTRESGIAAGSVIAPDLSTGISAYADQQTVERTPKKFWIMSDLHQEFDDYRWSPAEHDIPDHDAVILAGDTHSPATESVGWAERLTEKPVFMVMGNHEFYGTVMKDEIERARERASQSPNVHLLENDAVIFHGIRILGCTLWTDFDLFGDHNRAFAMRMVEKGMNDYRRIKRLSETSGRRRPLRPSDTLEQHRQSRRFLENELVIHRANLMEQDNDTPNGGKDHSASDETRNDRQTAATITGAPSPLIVIAHHAPTRRGIASDIQREIISAAYASNLDQLIEASQADLWVFGHTHVRFDQMIGTPSVVSNARGYPGYDRHNLAFDPAFIVEV